MRRYTNSIVRLKSPLQFWKKYYEAKKLSPDHEHLVHFKNGFQLAFPHYLMSAFDEIYLRGVYDEALQGLNENAVVVDLGANAGFFSMAALMRQRKLNVVAVEPLPVNANLFRHQMKLNGIDEVDLVEKAILTTDADHLDLNIESADRASVSASMLNKERTKSQLRVEVQSLDDLVRGHHIEAIDLLKIDCEGAEYNIIFNASDDLLHSVKRIVIETHSWVPESEGTIPELVKFLGAKDYRTRMLHKDILVCDRL